MTYEMTDEWSACDPDQYGCMFERTKGQDAYEAELLIRPNYDDGSKRKPWDLLPEVVRWSWNRNPTKRFSN